MIPSLYLSIARESIQKRLSGVEIDKKALLATYPEMSEPRATFVTLTLHGQLRGCIGSLVAHRSLIDDLVSNAQSAAFHDPRFPPLSKSELDDVRVEVSLLTEPQHITYRDANELSHIIRPNIDGVILRLGNRQATFLPQVWEELSDFESFFTHLGLKAGIGNNPISYHPDIYTYQVEKVKEE